MRPCVMSTVSFIKNNLPRLLLFSVQMELNAVSSYAFCSDYLFKLLLIGDSGVGKSCLLLRFAVRFSSYSILSYF